MSRFAFLFYLALAGLIVVFLIALSCGLGRS